MDDWPRRYERSVLAISPAQGGSALGPRTRPERDAGAAGPNRGDCSSTRSPIRTDNWDVTGPAILEADTVCPRR